MGNILTNATLVNENTKVEYILHICTDVMPTPKFANDLCDYCTGGVPWRLHSAMAQRYYAEGGQPMQNIISAEDGSGAVLINLRYPPNESELSIIKQRVQKFIDNKMGEYSKVFPTEVFGYILETIQTSISKHNV